MLLAVVRGQLNASNWYDVNSIKTRAISDNHWVALRRYIFVDATLTFLYRGSLRREHVYQTNDTHSRILGIGVGVCS